MDRQKEKPLSFAESKPACSECTRNAAKTWRELKKELKALTQAQAAVEQAAAAKDLALADLCRLRVMHFTGLVQEAWKENEKAFKTVTECSQNRTLASLW